MSAIASERLGDAGSGPQNEVLRPEVLQEILVQFRAELTKATDQSSAMGTHHENRFE